MRIKPETNRERYLQQVGYCQLCSAQSYSRRAGMLQAIIEGVTDKLDIANDVLGRPIKGIRIATRLEWAHADVEKAYLTCQDTLALIHAADRERVFNSGRFSGF